MAIDRARYSAWTYRQTGNQCVIAAYAAALWPFTGHSMDDVLAAYVAHFGLASTSLPDAAYDSDFHSRAAATPGGGYGVIHCVHSMSVQPVFVKARSTALVQFVPDAAGSWAVIEAALVAPKAATASVFINDNPGSPFQRMHAVALAHDGGFYGYDSNQGVVDLPAGKAQLGLLGNAFLVTEP